MPIPRRHALTLLSSGVALGTIPLEATAQAKRILDISIVGNQLGIHIPETAAIIEGLPAIAGYGPPKVSRIDQLRTLTSNLIAGATELATPGPTGIFAADEQGGDVKIIGYFNRNTSLVFAANADKIKSFKDLEKPENAVAVNGRGDFTEVIL
ncbi:MAG: hypothetical protein JO101_02390, partial [Candidatus Eremiobacteraeota bacterium]|nr:hypothetical protein [Candidatus Eremiobacteraeota bacterium]